MLSPRSDQRSHPKLRHRTTVARPRLLYRRACHLSANAQPHTLVPLVQQVYISLSLDIAPLVKFAKPKPRPRVSLAQVLREKKVLARKRSWASEPLPVDEETASAPALPPVRLGLLTLLALQCLAYLEFIPGPLLADSQPFQPLYFLLVWFWRPFSKCTCPGPH
jgi:hypothetical protein